MTARESPVPDTTAVPFEGFAPKAGTDPTEKAELPFDSTNVR
ncbi:MAG: hypothetical protein WA719_07415 [Thermoplasmata archaeon]